MRVGERQGPPQQALDQFIKSDCEPLGPRSPRNKHFLLSVRDGGRSPVYHSSISFIISDSIYTSVSKIVPRGESGILDSNPLNLSPFARLMVGEAFMDLSKKYSMFFLFNLSQGEKKVLFPSLTCCWLWWLLGSLQGSEKTHLRSCSQTPINV